MPYNFSEFKKNVSDTEEWLSKEYRNVRTGRATPALLDGVLVESYGSKIPISQTATVSVEDARTLRIAPWDASQVKDIEKAVIDADLGVSVSTDEKGSRISFPELTAERRGALMKVVKDKLEHARISIRSERDRVWHDIQEQTKKGEISEDEKFRYKEDMQKVVEEGSKKLDEVMVRKEKEVMG
jgi:ribosome recycling factor|tara:strand:- start:15659 stop:16210 length:552 start_codon:yes stop_codon:yes gene_type:complete